MRQLKIQRLPFVQHTRNGVMLSPQQPLCQMVVCCNYRTGAQLAFQELSAQELPPNFPPQLVDACCRGRILAEHNTSPRSHPLSSTLSSNDATLVRDCLLAAVPHVDSAAGVAWWCDRVAHLLQSNKIMRNIFATAPVKDAFVSLHSLATTGAAAASWCGAVSRLVTNHTAAQLLFGSDDVRACVISLQRFLDGPTSVGLWCGVIANLSMEKTVAASYDIPEIRDGLIAVSPFVSTSMSAFWWSRAVAEVVSHKEPKSVFGASAIVTALVRVSSHVCADEAARSWCYAVSYFANRYRTLLATSSVCDALCQVSESILTTESGVWWCAVASNIVGSEADAGLVDRQKVFGNSSFRDTLLRVVSKITMNDDVVRGCCSSLSLVLLKNPSVQHIFSTTAVRDMLINFQPCITTPQTACWWSSALSNTLCGNKSAQSKFCTAPCAMRCLLWCRLWLVANMHKIGVAHSRAWFRIITSRHKPCSLPSRLMRRFLKYCRGFLYIKWFFGGHITRNNQHIQAIFTTQSIHDALLTLQPRGDSPQAAVWWIGVVSNLANRNPHAATLFGTHEMFQVLTNVPSDSAAYAVRWCGAVARLTDHSPVLRRLFGTTCEGFQALMHIRRSVRTHQSTFWWCVVIVKILENGETKEATQEMYGNDEMRQAMVDLSATATSDNAAREWCVVLFHLVQRKPRYQAVFSCFQMRDALVVVATRVSSAASVKWWCTALSSLAQENRRIQELLITPEMHNALLVTHRFVKDADDARAWAGAVFGLARGSDNTARALRSSEMRAALATLRPLGTTKIADKMLTAAYTTLFRRQLD